MVGGLVDVLDPVVEVTLKEAILSVPDFPIPGIDFKDINPLLEHGEKFSLAVRELTRLIGALPSASILAVEARGFLFGAPVAGNLARGLILVRKPGKLPRDTDTFTYSCEYCSGTLEILSGSVRSGESYVIFDDLLATGGTARAIADYVKAKGGLVSGYGFAVEIGALQGRSLLSDAPVVSLLKY